MLLRLSLRLWGLHTSLLSLSCFTNAVQAQPVRSSLAALQLLFKLRVRLGGRLFGAALDRSA